MGILECYADDVGVGRMTMVLYDPIATMKNGGHGNVDGAVNNADDRDVELWAEHQNECKKAKKRVVMFNIKYKQPLPNTVFKWSKM